MIEVGRLCVKIAGRDAGKKCVVVEVIDDNYVLVDGETRRRKSNILHLEPLNQVLDIKKGASHETIMKAFEQLGLQVMKTTKPKKAGARPRRARKSKLAGPAPTAKTATKPAAKPAAKAPAEKKPVVKKAPVKKPKPKEEKKA